MGNAGVGGQMSRALQKDSCTWSLGYSPLARATTGVSVCICISLCLSVYLSVCVSVCNAHCLCSSGFAWLWFHAQRCCMHHICHKGACLLMHWSHLPCPYLVTHSPVRHACCEPCQCLSGALESKAAGLKWHDRLTKESLQGL